MLEQVSLSLCSCIMSYGHFISILAAYSSYIIDVETYFSTRILTCNDKCISEDALRFVEFVIYSPLHTAVTQAANSERGTY